MADILDDEQRAFLAGHVWAILATGRRNGSPQQSMIGYAVDSDGRILISAKAFTAKWRNALRRPEVCLAVPDGRACLVVYGTAETIAAEPERAECTADVFAAITGGERPDPGAIVGMLDEQQRTVIRITPARALFHT